MKKESRELASQLLDVTNEALAPIYDDIRTKLMGSLATSSLHIEGLREETLQRKANREFVEGFRDFLPQAEAWESDIHTWNSDKKASVFSVKDPFTAKAILTNTVWHSDGVFNEESSFTYYPHDYKPFYIIGSRKSLEPKRYTDLLLLSADVESRGLRHLLVKTNDFQRVKEWQNSYLHSDFTPGEVNHSYNHDTGLLDVTSVAGIHTTASLLSRGREMRVTPFNYGFDDITAKFGPTDDELAQFQVPEYLNHLATLFGVVEKYHELLAANKSDN